MSCRGFLQFMLKFTNFLLALVGGFAVIYSLWMMKEFQDEFPPSSPSPPIGPPSPPPVSRPPPVPVPSPAPVPPPSEPAPEPSPPAPESSPPARTPAPTPEPSPAQTPASTPTPSPDVSSSPPSPEPEPEPEPKPEPSPGSPPEPDHEPKPAPEPDLKPAPEPSDVAPGLEADIAELSIKDSESVLWRFDQIRRPFLSLMEKKVNLPKWPEPWFIYAFFGVGVTTLLITCTGHIAAETSHNFCLSCYLCLQILLVIAQLILAGFLFFDKYWRQDLPDDPTGQLDKVEIFIEQNLKICEWVALCVLIVEALGLFFAMTLRAISADSQRPGYDSDEEYSPRQPLLNRQNNQGAPPSGAAPAAAGAAGAPLPPRIAVRNDAWSARMREKYGLDTMEFTYNPEDSRRFAQPNQATLSTENKPNRCSIM